MKKRLLCLFLVLTLCLPTMTGVVYSTDYIEEEIELSSADVENLSDSTVTGDVNGDFLIDETDLLILSKHIARIVLITNETLLANGDINGDGTINSSDLTAFANLHQMDISFRIAETSVSDESVDVGGELTWSAFALGGEGEVEYAFDLIKYTDPVALTSYSVSEQNNNMVIASQDFGSESDFSVKMNEAGQYAVTIRCRDESGTVCTLENIHLVTVTNKSFDDILVTADVGKYICENTPITWTMEPIGGNPPFIYEYRVYYYSRSWETGTSSSPVYTFTDTAIGEYHLEVTCTDGNGISHTATSDVVTACDDAVYSPAPPVLRSDTIILGETPENAETIEAQDIFLNWNQVDGVQEYGLELSWHSAGQWTTSYSLENVRVTNATLSAALFRHSASRRLYRIGIYSTGIATGEMRYYYFYTIPSQIDESLKVDDLEAIAWDIAMSKKTVRHFTVTSELDWTASSDATWIFCENSGGELVVTVTENSGSNRTGTILITNGSNEVKITVRQGQGEAAPMLIYPPLSTDAANPTVRPVGGITLMLDSSDAAYTGVRIYEISSGKILVYEGILPKKEDFLHIIEPTQGKSFEAGKTYLVELAGRYSTEYKTHEQEFDLNSISYYIQMVNDGHEIFVEGSTHYTWSGYDDIQVSLYSTNTWTWSSDVEWLSVDTYEYVLYSKDIEYIDICMEPNYSNSTRTGNITFYCGNKKAIVTIHQLSCLPRFMDISCSTNMNSPTIIMDGSRIKVLCQIATDAVYKNGSWSAEKTILKTSAIVNDFNCEFTSENYEPDVLHRITLQTGEHTVVHYMKLDSSKTAQYALIKLSNGFNATQCQYDAPAGQTIYPIKILTTSSWKLKSNVSWLTVSSTSGSTADTWKSIDLSIKENNTGEERIGIITLSQGVLAETVYATLTVTQSASDYLKVFVHDDDRDLLYCNSNDPIQVLEGDGDNLSIMAYANAEWTAKSNNDWIKLKKNSTDSFEINENLTGAERIGSITVTCGKASKVVTVKQSVYLNPPVLVSPALSTTSKNPSVQKYDDMTLNWKAIPGAAEYKIVVNPEDEQLDIDSFYSFSQRIPDTGKSAYTITIPKEAFTINGVKYDYIKIYAYDQYGYYSYEYFYLTSTLGDIARLEGKQYPVWENATDNDVTKEYTVQSSSGWKAASKTSWIHIDRTSGVSGDVLKVTLERNYSNARTGTVEVNCGGTITVLTVNQCAALPEFPSILSPSYSNDKTNPTVIPANTTSITVTWENKPQVERYYISLRSFKSDTIQHVEARSGNLYDGETSYTFDNLQLTPGQRYSISIGRESYWGATSASYYFTPDVANAYVTLDGETRPERELNYDEDCSSFLVESSGVWTASVSDDWLMVSKRWIKQEMLDEDGYLSTDYADYSGTTGTVLYVSALPNHENSYRYGTVTVRSGGAEAVIYVAQEPYYKIAVLTSPVLATEKQNSTGVPYGDLTLRWSPAEGGSNGTYSIILEERDEKYTYRYNDILERNNISATTFTVPVKYLREGGYYRVLLCSDIGEEDGSSPGESYYFYVKYSNELSVNANVVMEEISDGQMMQISASATGGAGDYSFSYHLYRDGEVVQKSDKDDWDYYTFTLTERGAYQVKVYCTDGAGFSAIYTSSEYDWDSTVQDQITLSKTSFTSDTEGESISIIIQSNEIWQVESCPLWVTCSLKEGSSGNTVTLTTTENVSTQRTGNVIFISGTARAVFTVTQKSAVLRPAIVYPGVDAVIPAADILFRWTNVTEASRYLVSLRDLTTDILLVNQASVTGITYAVSAPILTEGHRYRVAVGAVTSNQTWWTESTFSLAVMEVFEDITTGSTVPITHDYRRVTVGTKLINQSLTVHDVVTTYYEQCADCGDKTTNRTDTVTVEHNFTYVGYESSHPHAKFHRCDCGAAPYTGDYKTSNGKVQDKADCCICHGHSYDADNPQEVSGKWYVYCTKCGVKKNVPAPNPSVNTCKHPNGYDQPMYFTEPIVYTNVDSDIYHIEYQLSYTVLSCGLCHATANKRNSTSQVNKKMPHSYGDDATCDLCGYKNPNGAVNYADRYVLYLGSKYYVGDMIYTGIDELMSLRVYDTVNKTSYRPSTQVGLEVSLEDPNGIARIEGDTFVPINSGTCNVVLTYFGQKVDTIPVGITVLSVEDKFFKYNIYSSGVVRMDDLNNINWNDANALITPWIAMGKYSATQNSDASHTVSFEVYNSSAEVLGFAVYDDQGNRVDGENTELINAHWETGSIVGGAWKTFSKTFEIWNSKSYDGAGTERTKITLRVPEGGYIRLLDSAEDNRVLCANLGEYILGTIKIAEDTEGLVNPADAKIMQELVEALGKEEFFEIIYQFWRRNYGVNFGDFVALFLEDNGDDYLTESIIQIMFEDKLMEDIINEVPEAILKAVLDKVEDGVLLLVPGFYLLKHGSQALYDFGGMAQLSVAFKRCRFGISEKYIGTILTPHRDPKPIDFIK